MYDQFANAIQVGQNTDTPASPIGNFPELAGAYKASFQAQPFAVAAGGNQALGNVADANAATAAKQRAQAINDRLKEIQYNSDPKNFQQIQKADGGYDFKDPTGQPLTVAQFAKVQNTTPDQILKGSTNPLDQQYVNDFNNLQKIVNAKIQGDQGTVNKMAYQLYGDQSKPITDPANVKVAQQFSTYLNSMKPHDLISAFTQYYPHVYGDQAIAQDPAHAPNVQPGVAYYKGYY